MRRKANFSERLFALLINQHRLWGTVLTPYIIAKEEGSHYYIPEECLSPYPSPATQSSLNEYQNEIIDLANRFSDRNLHSLFSREKNVVEFLDRVSDDRFNKHIKPFIEDKLFRILEIVRDKNIPVYRQKTGSVNLHQEDRVKLINENAIPVFSFELRDEGSIYRLALEIKGSRVELRNRDIEVLSNLPAALRIEDEIIFPHKLEAKKLLPFFKKEEINIPPGRLREYYSGFVLSVVNSYRVNAIGFEIIDNEAQKKARVILEHGIRNIPSLILKFRYEDVDIYSGSPEKSFTKFKPDGNIFRFFRYRRDDIWESSVIDFLQHLGYYSEDNINFTCICDSSNTGNELYSLIESLNNNSAELKSMGIEVVTGSVDNNYYLDNLDFTIESDIENDWFDLKAFVQLGDSRIPFTSFRKHILAGNREYTLSDGRILIIPEGWIERYKSLFELGVEAGNTLKIHKQHFSLLNDAFDKDECSICKKLEQLVIPRKFPQYKTPAGLRAELREYQKEGLNWLLFLQESKLGGCLADDMGLGKTLQTLSMLQYNKENIFPGKGANYIKSDQLNLFQEDENRLTSLLVVPSSLVHNWLNEIKKFTPGIRVYQHMGHNRRKVFSNFNNVDIIISSYHTVRQDIELISDYNFFYTILDESQLIKNPASQVYKAVSRIKSDHRLVLTGTPVENSLTDLWTQLNFVNPGILGSNKYFKKEFALPIEKEGKEDKELKLRKLIRPFILRRTKEQVARDLPAITRQTVFCDMSEEQSTIYEEEKNSIRNTILDSADNKASQKSAIMVLQGLMRLRLISNHPVLTDNSYRGSAGKFETVLEDIRSVVSEGHKILVFSSFVKHLEVFAEAFRKEKRIFSMLTGRSADREAVIKEFQSGTNSNIFLISLKTGGVGLNLTSADYVFILDPWWNPAAELQALNRAHRIGQDKNVFVYNYISTGSIEEKILRLQEKKSRLAETFISSSNPLKDLDIKELFELIG
ncbi:MAG: DEAD/DEAH box helicase [Marinilabiliaceae bacterium]|nr:DEAD/DEAH box helicase [Marinilabiliaceae bacterium]